jgi:hypothetical protein
LTSELSVNAVRTQDLSQNRRIARLTQLTRELEQSHTPEDTLRVLERGFTDVDGFVASLLLSTRGLSPGHYRAVGAQLKDEPLSEGERCSTVNASTRPSNQKKPAGPGAPYSLVKPSFSAEFLNKSAIATPHKRCNWRRNPFA